MRIRAGFGITFTVLSLLVVLPTSTAAAEATPITMVIEGELTDLSGGDGPAPSGYFEVGDHFIIAYTFDPSTMDVAPETWYGDYPGAISAVDIMIGVYSGADSMVAGNIQVGDGFNDVDFYAANTQGMNLDMGDGLVLDRFTLGRNDLTGSALESDALLTTAEQLLSLADYNQVSFAFSGPAWGGVTGVATSIHVAEPPPIEHSVARVQTASALFRSAGECDFDELHVTETAGKVKTLGRGSWNPFADVVIDLSQFRGCELVSSYQGFSEVDATFVPLRSTVVGPLTVELVNVSDPDDVIISQFLLRWTAFGRPRPRVTHDGDFHRWDRFVPARVNGHVTLNGTEFFPGAEVVEAEMTRGIQFDSNQ